MSNTPGISPITTDIEEVRHSESDGFFGDGDDSASSEEETEEVADETHDVVEDRRDRVFNP